MSVNPIIIEQAPKRPPESNTHTITYSRKGTGWWQFSFEPIGVLHISCDVKCYLKHTVFSFSWTISNEYLVYEMIRDQQQAAHSGCFCKKWRARSKKLARKTKLAKPIDRSDLSYELSFESKRPIEVKTTLDSHWDWGTTERKNEKRSRLPKLSIKSGIRSNLSAIFSELAQKAHHESVIVSKLYCNACFEGIWVRLERHGLSLSL